MSKAKSSQASQQDAKPAPDDLTIGGVQVCKKGELLTPQEFAARCRQGWAAALKRAKAKLGL